MSRYQPCQNSLWPHLAPDRALHHTPGLCLHHMAGCVAMYLSGSLLHHADYLHKPELCMQLSRYPCRPLCWPCVCLMGSCISWLVAAGKNSGTLECPSATVQYEQQCQENSIKS